MQQANEWGYKDKYDFSKVKMSLESEESPPEFKQINMGYSRSHWAKRLKYWPSEPASNASQQGRAGGHRRGWQDRRIQSPGAVTWHPARGCCTRNRKLSRNLICSGILALKTQILIWSFVAGRKKMDRSCLFVFNSCGFHQTFNRKPSSQRAKVKSDVRKQLPVQLKASLGHTFTPKLNIYSALLSSLPHLGHRWSQRSAPAAVPGKIFTAASRNIQ